MEVKTKNLKVVFCQNKKANAVCLMVGWAAPTANWFVLNKLKHDEPCRCPILAHGSECTALCYAMMQNVKKNLIGDVKAQQATKVSGVGCNLQNGEFYITICCQGTLSSIRKALTVTMASLVPEKLYPQYSMNIKHLNGHPHREEFAHCVNALSLDKICVQINGKANLDDAKLKLIAETAEGKLTQPIKQPKAEKPASLKETLGKSDYPTLKAKGMAAVLLADFLESQKQTVAVANSAVIVYNEKFDPKKINKAAVDRWAAKFSKIKDLSSALAYLACTKGRLNPADAHSASKAKTTAAQCATMVKAAL